MSNDVLVLCPLCKTNTKHYINAPDNDSVDGIYYKVYFCNSCDIGFIPDNCKPNDINENYELFGYYSEFDNDEVSDHKSSLLLLWLETIFYKKRLNTLCKFVNNGNLLDVGCGSGKFISTASNKFQNIIGIEVSNQGRKFLKHKKIKFYKSLYENKLKKDFFHAITFWHSFEHMEDPKRILKEIKRLLKVDGFLLLSVPNYNSISSFLFKKNWFHLDVPRHIYHYTENSLTKIVSDEGYEVINVYKFFPEYDISGILQSLLNYFGLGNNILKKSMKYGRKEKNVIGLYFLLPFFVIPFILIWFLEIIMNRNETFCLICKKKNH